MKTEKEIADRIIEIESIWDPDDESSYLDEGQQSELYILRWVLDRDLNEVEIDILQRKRKEVM